MPQSKLPKDLEWLTVAHMDKGSEGFVSAYSIVVDNHRAMWIRGDSSAHMASDGVPEPGKESDYLRIQRTATRVFLYRSSIGVDVKFRPTDRMPAAQWIPLVVELIDD